MSLLKSVEKQLKKLMGKNALMLIAGAVVVYMICQYSSNKGMSLDGMTGSQDEEEQQGGEQAMPASAGQPAPSAGAVETNVAFASADGISTSQPNMASGCTRKQIDDPKSLLPVQSGGNAFNGLNPNGSGDLSGVNLLQAGQHLGMTSQTLRNANLQVRSEPANPQMNVGPWNGTTMEADKMRRPLEIGAGSQ